MNDREPWVLAHGLTPDMTSSRFRVSAQGVSCPRWLLSGEVVWANPNLLNRPQTGLLCPQALTCPILPSYHLPGSGTLDDLKLLKPQGLSPEGLRLRGVPEGT